MKKGASLGTGLIVIGAVMLAFALVFYFKPSENVELDFEQLDFTTKMQLKDDIKVNAASVVKDKDIVFLQSDEGNIQGYFLGEAIPFTLDFGAYVHNGKYKLTLDVVVYGADGKIDAGLSRKAVDSVDSSADVLSSHVLSYDAKIPGNYPAGEYVIELMLNDEIDGKRYVKRSTFKLSKKLFIRNMLFASTVDENYNYVSKPSPVYSYGNTVWVYFELVGFSKDQNRVHFTEDLEVRGPDGAVISFLTVSSLIELEEFVAPDKNFYRLKNQFPVGDWLSAGKYAVKVTVHDLIAEIDVSDQAMFELVEV